MGENFHQLRSSDSSSTIIFETASRDIKKEKIIKDIKENKDPLRVKKYLDLPRILDDTTENNDEQDEHSSPNPYFDSTGRKNKNVENIENSTFNNEFYSSAPLESMKMSKNEAIKVETNAIKNYFDLSFDLFEKPEINISLSYPKESYAKPISIFIHDCSSKKSLKRIWDQNSGVAGLKLLCQDEFHNDGDVYLIDQTYKQWYLIENHEDVYPGAVIEYRKINDTKNNDSSSVEKMLIKLQKLIERFENTSESNFPVKNSSFSKKSDELCTNRTNIKNTTNHKTSFYSTLRNQILIIRNEMDDCKSTLNSFTSAYSKIFDQINQKELEFSFENRNLNKTNSMMDEMSELIKNLEDKLSAFQILLEITRKDLTRRVRPPKNLSQYIISEYNSLQLFAKDTIETVMNYKKILKEKWRIELRNIMKSQDLIAKFEIFQTESNEEIKSMQDCIHTVTKILEYHETHPANTNKSNYQIEIQLDYENRNFVKEELMNSVLGELITKQNSIRNSEISNDPLNTLEKFELIRKTLKQNLKNDSGSNNFEEDLIVKVRNWCGLNDLKKLDEKIRINSLKNISTATECQNNSIG